MLINRIGFNHKKPILYSLMWFDSVNAKQRRYGVLLFFFLFFPLNIPQWNHRNLCDGRRNEAIHVFPFGWWWWWWSLFIHRIHIYIYIHILHQYGQDFTSMRSEEEEEEKEERIPLFLLLLLINEWMNVHSTGPH